MKVIGLTGGIGSGKSTASDYLKSKGCEIIDADAISREMTGEGGDALVPLLNAFGPEIFTEDGLLDRQKLADLVFSDPARKELLEEIVTKACVKETLRRIDALRAEGFDGIVIMDAPLLFECGAQEYCDETWLVIANLDTRVMRVKKRDGISTARILARIDNQMSDAEKEKLATHIIDNSMDLEWLYRQIDIQLARLR